MAARSKKKAAKQAPPTPARDAPEVLRAWLLAVLVTLCVARPLLPSEGVSWYGDGQPFNMLWIVLAAAYLLLSLARGRLERPLDVVDVAVAALVVICAASALVGAWSARDELELGLVGTGSPRLTINMLWEWVALGLMFFLTRQMIRTACEARALVAVMMALAVVLAAYGFYQVFVGLPAAREQYAQNPDRVLRELNQWFPAGSAERMRFESRLQSTEPLGTFALTNSLAGFLVPWLVVALGIVLSMAQRPAIALPGHETNQPWRWGTLLRAAGLVACLLAVAGCLVLTKSRSAYVALLAGALVLPLAGGAGRRMFNWKAAVGAAVAVLLLVGGALAVKGLDAQVLTEASKSLGFRWQYWRSTLSLIGRYPWLGVGPGNFQDYYTQVKLPEASEEIRDPHNFLLEVWVTGGTFALAALGAVLGVVAWRTWTAPRVAWGAGPANERAVESSRPVAFMAAGAAAGFVLAFLIAPAVGLSLSEEQLASGLAIGAAVFGLLWPWVMRGTLPARLAAVGALVLAIHLLASGGIAFAGVAGTFWMLLALALNQLSGEPAPSTSSSKSKSVPVQLGLIGAMTLTVCAGVACYLLAYRPVLSCRAEMSLAEDSRQDAAARLRHYFAAADSDPLSAEPWRAIAELEMDRLRQNPQTPHAYRNFVAATRRMTELQPHASSTWRQAGNWYAELHRRNHDEESGLTAVEYLRNAVELYPNLAALEGEYALALAAAGQPKAARRQAEKAVRLDEQTPHADKKLPPELAKEVHELLDGDELDGG